MRVRETQGAASRPLSAVAVFSADCVGGPTPQAPLVHGRALRARLHFVTLPQSAEALGRVVILSLKD